MTALTRLTLSHFRSHRLTRLVPGGQSVVLYGPNGAGKTNVLEAVSMLSPGRGLRRAAAGDMVRTPEGVGWKVTAATAAHRIETWSEDGNGRSVKIDDKPVPQSALANLLAVVWLVPTMDRLWTEGADGRRRFLDRIALSFRPSHGEAALAYEKAMRERNRLLRDQVSDAHWYAALEAQMARAGSEIETGRAEAVERLAEAQAGAETTFPRSDLTLTDPGGEPCQPRDEPALADALARSRAADLGAGRSLVGPHRADLHGTLATKGIDARDASTGEQKALLISLVLANTRALTASGRGNPVLLLDEVAAHLDADRRAALFDEIFALGAQAWMTGTGAELFEGLEEKSQFLKVKEVGGVSEVGDAD